MMNQHLKILVNFLALNLLIFGCLVAQENQVVIVVIDETGISVPDAAITIGEGSKPLFTNEKGEFILDAKAGVTILIEAAGYESQMISSTALLEVNIITLIKPGFHLSERDIVNVPFGSFRKRQIPGATSIQDIPEILKYDQSGNIFSALNGRVSGMMSFDNLRGNGKNLLVVVDGIPRAAGEYNLQQIEQITVLKDLSSAMLYGSQANNGVILITTKQGKPLKKDIHFTAEKGFYIPVSYPEYLAAGAYMELFNEALQNDGLPERYSPAEIAATKNGDDPVRYPDEHYFNSKYLNNFNSFFHLVGEASGGNEIANYYLNLGWNRENSLLNLGEGNNENYNRLNMRANINYNISKNIAYRFDGMVIFNLSRTPRYTDRNFWELSSSLHPNYYPVLIPSDMIKDADLLAAAKFENGNYLLGSTSEFQTNIYGELSRNGFSLYNNRLIHLNTGLDFNLDFITQGLTARANVSMDMLNMFRADLQNSYAVYQLFYNADSVSSISKYGQDVRRDNQSIVGVDFYRRNVIYGNIDYNRLFNDKHTVKVTSLMYADIKNVQDSIQPLKHLHFGIRGNYIYRNKYLAEITGIVAGSGKLLESQPYAFSPGIGLGWILTEENFLKHMSKLNYLKIRGNWALLSNDMNIGYFHYEDWFGRNNDFHFGQGTYNNTSRLVYNGNNSLRWEKTANTNIGFESMFFNYKLGIEGSYFYYKSFDLLSQRPNTLPAYFAGNSYQNFESNQVQGVETDIHYTVNLGELRFKIGANLTYAVPKALKVDEINYLESYLTRQGKATDAMFGWVALGLFEDQDDIDNHNAVQTFGTVRPGDIKYKDLNNDGLIDDLDRTIIGNSMPRVGYGLNLTLNYNNFNLFILGTGQNGQNTIFNHPYYWVYGDLKYSEQVLNRWTQETASTAKYPRLSSGSNPNNFRNSTFWLEKNNWFRIHTTQLSYTLPELNFAGINGAIVYFRGSNLLTISKIKDKTDLNIGEAPQTRAFSVGFTATF